MFILKKLVSGFLNPIPIIILIFLIGIFFLWFTRKQKTGKLIVTLGFICLIFISFSYFSNLLIFPLEQTYSKYTPSLNESVKYVVVLGGGARNDKFLPESSRLSSSSMFRLIEGIYVYNNNPGSKLIFSGASFIGNTKSNAKVMSAIVELLGINKDDIIILSKPKDTKEEAFFIKDIVKNDLFVLVTSAAHMKRSMLLFQNLGLKPIPAPTDYLVSKEKSNFEIIKFPGSCNIGKIESAIHEYLGILWYSLVIKK